jgi:D-serine deaminase-like pyridoxal phosphate-dependent protein
MAYEAQIAGLPDRGSPLLLGFKRLSRRDVANKRRELAEALKAEGIALRFFNGGGSGSATTTVEEEAVTEVTVGSGLLQSHLFDGYRGQKREAALFFALPVTRVPEAGIITCQSGGFIASGAPGPDRAPSPWLPAGLSPLKDEGFGEVQTPLRHPSELKLAVGDPIFFRPAKAGEIAERFSRYVLLRGDEVHSRVQTYRGLGQTFY